MSKPPAPSVGPQLRPFVAPFRFDGSAEFHLKSHKTNEKGGLDKARGEKILDANRKRLNDFQEKLYAQDRWSLLLIFQGMDAAGKDSAIKSVFDGVNPQGCEVTSFKQPSTHELDHDFMWRSSIALPRSLPMSTTQRAASPAAHAGCSPTPWRTTTSSLRRRRPALRRMVSARPAIRPSTGCGR